MIFWKQPEKKDNDVLFYQSLQVNHSLSVNGRLENCFFVQGSVHCLYIYRGCGIFNKFILVNGQFGLQPNIFFTESTSTQSYFTKINCFIHYQSLLGSALVDNHLFNPLSLIILFLNQIQKFNSGDASVSINIQQNES